MTEFEEIKAITPDIAAKLRNANIHTVEAFSNHSFNDLKEKALKGVDSGKIHDIQVEVWQRQNYWFMPASNLKEIRKNELTLTTGCEALDRLLAGGIRSQVMTEFAGEYASGKTECLLTILAEALGRNPEWSAIFFDTENTFRETRLTQISIARGYDPEDVLKRTIYAATRSVDNFVTMVEAADIFVTTRNIKLVLVDSITAQLRAEYIGRDKLNERQGQLNKILHSLLAYAKGFNLAVAVTNQVVSDPGTPFTFDPVQQKTPIGGNIQAHNAETRIHLRKGHGTTRIARLIDSSWLPEGECRFRLGEKGIEDIPKEPKEEEKKQAQRAE